MMGQADASSSSSRRVHVPGPVVACLLNSIRRMLDVEFRMSQGRLNLLARRAESSSNGSSLES